MKYDIAIIGAGAAGLSVASAAAQFGEKVVLFEKGAMGGDCLNSGCIPSKSLLAAAQAAQAHRTSAAFGVAADEPQINFARVMAHVETVVAGIAPHDSQSRFEGLGVTVIRSAAHFTSPQTVEAQGRSYTARRIVIATGSRPAIPPLTGLASVPYFTNETIFRNRVLPHHLIIIGGGPIGLEMAQAHRRLGSAVTVIEAAKVFARDDVDCAAVVIDALMAEGIVIHQQALISAIEKTPVGIRVSLHEKAAIEGTHLLLATGRKSNIEGLELPAGNVASDARGISVDRSLRSTTNRRVYAAGDVAGSLQFTHAANYHAGLIIRNALFRLPTRNQTDMLPWVTYTDPELAHVGLTEGTARRLHGDTIKVLTSHFSDNDRARTGGKTEGLVKVVTTARGVILGCSIAGPGAGEQIAMWSLAVSRKLKISAIAGLVLPYPSRTEAGKRAAVSYYADLPQSSWARRLIGLLKRFG